MFNFRVQGSGPSASSSPMPLISLIVIFPFVVLAALIWAVLGLFFWIPLLAKSVTIFTFTILAHAIVDRPATASAKNLEKAILYYVNGFVIILRTLDLDRRSIHSEDQNEGNSSLFLAILNNLSMILQTLLFSVLFWISLFLFLHHSKILYVHSIDQIEIAIGRFFTLPR
jgi:hypothetical protein